MAVPTGTGPGPGVSDLAKAKDWVARVVRIAGGSVETVPWPPERKKIDIGSIYVDHSRLTALTGWEPRVGLREGLAETLAFYREHGDHYWS